MPTTINGYHLWQLPTDSSPEPEEGIQFSELRNDLGNGYRSQVLYGSSSGLRSWKLKMPTLAGGSLIAPALVGINSDTLSRESYVWDLYCETKISGNPFVYQSQRSSQYYLVEFVDKKLTYDKLKVQLYSTGVEIAQVRIDGVTVFDPTLLSTSRNIYDETTHDAITPQWDDVNVGSYLGFMVVGGDGDIIFDANPQNGLNTVRFNSTTGAANILTANSGSVPTTDIFLVMKMRESTFSSNCGVLTASSGSSSLTLLRGTNGGTKFQDPGVSSVEYRKNGILYAPTDMQAPMNTWGVVHCRSGGTSPPSLFAGWTNIQLGQDRAVAATFAKMDVAEILFYGGTTNKRYMTMSEARELTEHLIVKWGVS